MIQIPFNQNRASENVGDVLSLSFDRGAEAIAAGNSKAIVSIFDVEAGKRLRDLNCHSNAVTAISWNRSCAAPYIVATGSADSTIVFHDIRKKMSVIS